MNKRIDVGQTNVVQIIDGLDALDKPIGRRAQLHRQEWSVRQPREPRQRTAGRATVLREL